MKKVCINFLMYFTARFTAFSFYKTGNYVMTTTVSDKFTEAPYSRHFLIL